MSNALVSYSSMVLEASVMISFDTDDNDELELFFFTDLVLNSDHESMIAQLTDASALIVAAQSGYDVMDYFARTFAAEIEYYKQQVSDDNHFFLSFSGSFNW